MDKFLEGCFTILFAIIIGALIYGTIIYFLWNWLMPVIFGLPTITWIQGYALSVLSSCLFPNTSANTKS